MLRTILSLVSLLAGMNILLMGVGLLGTLVGLRAGLEGFSAITIGLIMSGYFAGYTVGIYLCPPMIRRVGHVRAFATFATIASAVAVAFVLVVNPLAWIAFRILIGACLVGLYMVVESWLNTLAPAQRRGSFFSLYTSSTLLAMGIGQYLLLLGEVASFELFALSTVIVSFALVPVLLTRVQQPEVVETPNLSLRALYLLSPLGVIGTLLAGIAAGAFWGMGPVFAHLNNFSDTEVAGFMSATIFGGALLQWPIGHLSDFFDRRSVIMLVATGAGALAAAGYLLLPMAMPFLLTGAVIYGALAFTLYALCVAYVNDYLQPSEILDATRGLLLVFGIGAALGPTLAGFAMGAVGGGGLLLFNACVLLGLGIYTVYRQQRRVAPPVEEQGEFVPMVSTSPVALEADPRTEEARIDEGATQEGEPPKQAVG